MITAKRKETEPVNTFIQLITLLFLLFVLLGILSCQLGEGERRHFLPVEWDYSGNKVAVVTSATKSNLYLYSHTGNQLGTLSFSSIDDISWHPQKELLALATASNSLAFVWAEQMPLKYQAYPFSGITRVGWNSEGDEIAVGTANGTIHVMEVTYDQSGNISLSEAYALRNTPHSEKKVLWSPNNELIVSLSYEGIVRIWDTNEQQLLYTLDYTDKFSQLDIEWNRATQSVAVLSNRNISFVSVISGEVIESYAGMNLSFNPEGDRMVVHTNFDGDYRIQEVLTGNYGISLEEISGSIDSVAWSPSGNSIAGLGINKGQIEIWFWDVDNGRLITRAEIQ